MEGQTKPFFSGAGNIPSHVREHLRQLTFKFWQCQHYYPNYQPFSPDQFALQPQWLIDQALEAAYRIEVQRANLMAIPVANLGVSHAASSGVKRPKSEWFNPYSQLLKALELKGLVDKPTLGLILELVKNGKMPGWAVSLLDLQCIKLVYTLTD